jgi:hypothetical protein
VASKLDNLHSRNTSENKIFNTYSIVLARGSVEENRTGCPRYGLIFTGDIMKTNQDILIDDEIYDNVELDIEYCYDHEEDCFIIISAIINMDKFPLFENVALLYYQDVDVWESLSDEQKLTIFEEIEDEVVLSLL